MGGGGEDVPAGRGADLVEKRAYGGSVSKARCSGRKKARGKKGSRSIPTKGRSRNDCEKRGPRGVVRPEQLLSLAQKRRKKGIARGKREKRLEESKL